MSRIVRASDTGFPLNHGGGFIRDPFGRVHGTATNGIHFLFSHSYFRQVNGVEVGYTQPNLYNFKKAYVCYGPDGPNGCPA